MHSVMVVVVMMSRVESEIRKTWKMEVIVGMVHVQYHTWKGGD